MSPRPRTSQTHPLQIDTLTISAGTLGLTLCPGRKDHSSHGPHWDRDLTTDLEAIEAWGADIVATFLEVSVFTLLQIPHYSAEVTTRTFRWLHLPIPDMSIPSEAFERRWQRTAPLLDDCLLKGGKVLFHCRGGLGRSGLVAAKMLVRTGLAPVEAIAHVRKARTGAIETSEQENYIKSLPSGAQGSPSRDCR